MATENFIETAHRREGESRRDGIVIFISMAVSALSVGGLIASLIYLMGK